MAGPRPRAIHSTPAEHALIGRDAELAAIREVLASPGGLVLIAGEAGIGKTRLAREAARLAEDQGRPIVWGRPEQVTAPGPFALILDLIDNLMGRAATGASEQRALVSRLLDPGEWGAGGNPPVREIAARLRGFLAALGPRPLAVFEDLQAADAASQAVVAHLAHSAVDDEHLLVATYRPEEVTSDDALSRFLALVSRERLAREITLEPLDLAASSALASALIAGAGPADLESIVALADGVPFFIEELAAAQVGVGAAGSVPDTIARAVATRLRPLGEEARRVVVAASLAPGWIDVDVLCEALGLSRDAVVTALAAAVRAALLEDRQGRLVFRHALVRESVRADLVSVEIEELNRLLGGATEQVYAGRLETHARALSHYWYEGRDRVRAHRYALLAGDRALALAATQDARESYELALACGDGDQPDALLGLAEADIREGRTTAVETLLRRAAEGFAREERRSEAARALARLAWVLSVGGGDTAADVVDEALRLVSEEEHPPDVARLLATKGQILTFRGRADEAAPLLERAAAIAARVGDHAVRAESLDSLSWAADQDCRVDEALTLAGEARRFALESGAAEAIGRTHNNAAQLLTFHGRTDDALELLRVARERLVASLGTGYVAIIDLTEGMTRWRRGEPETVARLVARGEVGWARWRTMTRTLQAWSSLHLGDGRRARATVARCWEELGGDARAEAEDPDGMDVDRSQAAVCEILIGLEEDDAGCAPLAESLVAYNKPWPARHLHVAPLAGRAALLAGNARRASQILADAREDARRYPAPYEAALLLELEGLLAPDRAGAEERFRASAAAFEACGNLVDRARALRLAAGAAEAAGERARAVEALKSARGLALRAGSGLEVARSEAALRAVGVRPRAGRPRKEREESGALSTREEEVASLVAAGATNAEIAGRLYLSERTVQDHITHALRKLGLGGRAGLAAWAAKRGLV